VRELGQHHQSGQHQSAKQHQHKPTRRTQAQILFNIRTHLQEHVGIFCSRSPARSSAQLLPQILCSRTATSLASDAPQKSMPHHSALQPSQKECQLRLPSAPSSDRQPLSPRRFLHYSPRLSKCCLILPSSTAISPRGPSWIRG
jgi:hypothetical protein